MMPAHTPPNGRRYEGPARLYSSYYDERMTNDGAAHFTRLYGERGTGWDLDTSHPRHAQHNELQRVSEEPEFRLATEALSNWLRSGDYVLDDGQDMTGKVQRHTARPAIGNLVIYPDGDIPPMSYQ